MKLELHLDWKRTVKTLMTMKGLSNSDLAQAHYRCYPASDDQQVGQGCRDEQGQRTVRHFECRGSSRRH